MSAYVYPRLSDGDALLRLAELGDAAAGSVRGLHDLVALTHERAAPVPTGGPVAGQVELSRLRGRVVHDLSGFLDADRPISGGFREFDWALGRSLWSHLEIVVSDAAHRSTWNFLSLMVFPDLVWNRFPDPSEERALGTPRNVLRRVWNRYKLLGDLDGRGAEALNEDELVQLTERTSLARNRRLVSALALRVIAYSGPRRMEFTRELAKRATFVTGPLLIDVLTDSEVEDLADALAAGQRWSPSPG